LRFFGGPSRQSPHQSLVTLLENVSASPVSFVEVDRVAGLKGLHHLGEIARGRLYQQVDVVA